MYSDVLRTVATLLSRVATMPAASPGFIQVTPPVTSAEYIAAEVVTDLLYLTLN